MREKTLFGMFWKFAERISAQLTSLVVSIVLARLLLPEYYGIVSIVMVIITLCNVLVSNGLGTALIQKKDADALDFSTIFHFGLLVSVAVYALLFLAAPWIAYHYEMSLLTPVIRVMGLRIILASVNVVQHAYVSKTMQFKRFFWSTLLGTVISGVVGIAMAYRGYGVWALVAQYLTNTTIDTIVLFITVRWRPRWMFSFSRLRGLLDFGWKMMAAALVNEIYNSLRTLIIGKVYSTADLSFYNKADSFPTLISRNIESSLSSVLFPVISTVQDDTARVKQMLRTSVKVSSYVIFPMLLGFAVVAEDFVRIVLTEKWLPCVPYLQLLCISHCLSPISSTNHQAIKALGRSDITMKQEIIVKAVGVAVILVTVPISVMAIVWGAMAIEVWHFAVTVYPNKKLLNYPIGEQLRDILPNLLLSLCMAAIVYSVGLLPLHGVWRLLLRVLCGAVVYGVLSFVTKNAALSYILSMLHKKPAKGR